MNEPPSHSAPFPLRSQSGIRCATVSPIRAQLAPIGQDLFSVFRAQLMQRYAEPAKEPRHAR
jgi:hypothetical protein